MTSSKYHPLSPLLLSYFLLCSIFNLNSQTAAFQPIEGDFLTDSKASQASMFNHLKQDEVLRLQLKAPLHTLIKKKKEEEKYPATLSYTDKSGALMEQAIKVRTRGNMRKEICGIPPIKIYFPKEELTAAGFNKKFNDYKLVLKCRNIKGYDDYVFKEYLAYKLYNVLTDYSYRVQLIQLNITDTENRKKQIETFGFIIENKDELANRLNGEIIKPKILSPRGIVPEFYDLMTVFQYMIGNTDWYMYNQHNLKVLKSADHNFLITIPYDFDYAGMVSTKYAAPHKKLPINAVSTRYFLGRCREQGAYDSTLELFKSKKGELLSVVQNFEHLNPKAKTNLLNYLTEFFEILEDPKATRNQIVEHCGMHVKAE